MFFNTVFLSNGRDKTAKEEDDMRVIKPDMMGGKKIREKKEKISGNIDDPALAALMAAAGGIDIDYQFTTGTAVAG